MGFFSGLFKGIGKLAGGVLGLSTGTVGGAVVSSVLGGLLGGRGSSEQKTTSSVDYVALRNAAEAAGFNPLTALQNGGAAGFATQTSVVPPMSSGDLIKKSLGAGLQTWFNRDKIEMDRELAHLELQQARNEVALQKRQLSGVFFPRSFGFAPTESVAQNVVAQKPPLAADAPPPMKTGNMFDRVYNPLTGNWVVIPNPDYTESGPAEMATGLATLGLGEAVENGVVPFWNQPRTQVPAPSPVDKSRRPGGALQKPQPRVRVQPSNGLGPSIGKAITDWYNRPRSAVPPPRRYQD